MIKVRSMRPRIKLKTGTFDILPLITRITGGTSFYPTDNSLYEQANRYIRKRYRQKVNRIYVWQYTFFSSILINIPQTHPVKPEDAIYGY